MWSPYQLAIAVGMVVTGSINTLATKWADKQCAYGTSPDVVVEPCESGHPFQHPFLQAVGMFVGEFSCIIVFQLMYFYQKRKFRSHPEDIKMGNQNFNPILFLGPAACDMTGTSLMYIGLNYTYASSFQMLRGAIIVFTALLSVAFLRSSINKKSWLGIAMVIVGLALVGISDIVFSNPSDGYGINEILTGDLIILVAQIISAVQMVVEEKYVNGKDIHPLQAVGWEGFFGMTILGLLLIPMYYIPAGEFSGNPRGVLEDAIDGLSQIGQNSTLAVAQFGSICSIAFFNFFGISVTKELSATTRMVLDSIRTLVIWGVSLAVKWEKFQYLQVIGFVILIGGTGVYNNLIPIPCLSSPPQPNLSTNNEEEQKNFEDYSEKTPLLYDTQSKSSVDA